MLCRSATSFSPREFFFAVASLTLPLRQSRAIGVGSRMSASADRRFWPVPFLPWIGP